MNTRILHTTAILGSILLCLVAFSCKGDPESGTIGLDVLYAFSPAGNINLIADTDHIRPSGEMVLTVRGTPRVTGTGRILFGTWSQQREGAVIIESPIHDTIRNPVFQQPDTGRRNSIIPFSFVANQEFAAPWQLHITNVEYHTFRATAFIDSIFIPDSGRLYPSQSDIVRKYMNVPRGKIFDTDANAIEMEIKL